MAATSTSPVKILLDLGIDLDNLSSEENYLSALMEGAAAIESATKGKGDGRSAILREEVVRVRKSRKAADPNFKQRGESFKITKKTISAQKLLNPSKLGPVKGGESGGQGGDLIVIKEKVVAIEKLLGEQFKFQEEQAKDAKQEAENKRRSLKERLLEGSGKIFDGVKKATNKVLKPFQSVWENIIGFIKKIILGRVLFKILEWTSNPENQGKIDSIFKFLKDWWPVLLTAYLAFGNGLSKFVIGLTGKLVVLGAKLVAKVIPALIKAAAAMGPFGVAALGVAAVGGIMLGVKALDGDFSDKERTDEEKEADKEKVDSAMDMGVLSMNKGGIVPGSGNTDTVLAMNKGGTVPGSGNTDTVPAMLTPGEFVMSKGAVQKYGADTLAGMNAAAGGTNIPTPMGGFNEGGFAKRGVVTNPKERQQQEAYMLKFVNEERALQGMEPLNDLTYAPNVELTKPMGKEYFGGGIKETSDTDIDLDRGIKTRTRTKTRGDESIFSVSMEQTTDEDREKFFAENPHAAQLLNLKNQSELDSLGSSISASAKMNGGGLVQGLQGGGSVQGFQGGGGVGFFKGMGNIMSGKKFSGESRAQIGRSVSKSSNITPPTKSPKVTVINQPGTEQADASQAQLPPQGNREIPSFDASVIRNPKKMEVLGISM